MMIHPLNPKLDKIGITASMLCAVHCLIVPLLITLFPILGLSFLASEWVEWGLLIGSALLGVSSLCLGYKTHRSRRGFVALSIGLALLVLGRITHTGAWHEISVWLLVMGGLIMAGAHYINRWLCHRCTRCHSP